MSSPNQLLRQYYKLDTPNLEKEARDIDSPRFDPKRFYEDTIKNEPLLNILTLENKIVSDIRSFDNELQGLVYDNYSRFLGATDTVRSLRSKITELREQSASLNTMFDKVAEKTESIGEKLNPTRSAVQELSGISRLLKGVEFISKLPSQLSDMLKNERYSEAARLWSKVEPILESQESIPSFKRILAECKDIVEEIKVEIRGQMLNTEISVSDSVMYACLLSELKIPLPTVCSQLSHHRYLVLDNILEFETCPDEPFEALDLLNDIALSDLHCFIDLYRKELMKDANNTNMRRIESILVDFLNISNDRINQFLSPANFSKLDTNSFCSYLRKFQQLMSPISNPNKIEEEIRRILQKYAENNVMSIFTEHMALLDDNSEDVDVASSLERSVTEMLNQTNLLTALDFKDITGFCVQQLSLAFVRIFDYLDHSMPQNSLFLTFFADKLAKITIPNIYALLKSFPSNLPIETIQEQLIIDCRSASERSLKRFIQFEKRTIDSLLFKVMKNGYPIHESHEGASDVFNEVQKVLISVDSDFNRFSVEKNLNNYANDAQMNLKHSMSSLKSTQLYGSIHTPSFTGRREEGILQIERLFSSINRLGLNHRVGLVITEIMTNLVMYTLKTIIENVRTLTLTNEEFHQVQIDSYFIFKNYEDIVEQTELFVAMIEEMIVSSYDRTVSPLPMDTQDLERIFMLKPFIVMDILTALEAARAPLSEEELKEYCGVMFSTDRLDVLLRAGDIGRVEGLPDVYWSIPAALKKRKATNKYMSPVRPSDRANLIKQICDLRLKLTNAQKEYDALSLKKDSFATLEQQTAHQNRLHKYNDIKESALVLLGKLAAIDGTTVRKLYEDYNLTPDD